MTDILQLERFYSIVGDKKTNENAIMYYFTQHVHGYLNVTYMRISMTYLFLLCCVCVCVCCV